MLTKGDPIKSDIIRDIANILFLNLQLIDCTGLLRGKLGVAVFFYHYSRYTGIDSYKHFSDNYINFIFKTNINARGAKDFDNGSLGIGWAIDHLIKNKFIEAENNDILEELDYLAERVTVIDILSELNNENPIFSKGIYFAQRDNRIQSANALNDCLIVIEKSSGYSFPLSFINSILFFIMRCYEMNISDELCGKICCKIIPFIVQCVWKHNYKNGDIYLLKESMSSILNSSRIESKEWIMVFEKLGLLYESIEYEPLNYIYHYDIFKLPLNISMIKKYVSEPFVLSIESQKLCINNGLAGLGIELMKPVVYK